MLYKDNNELKLANLKVKYTQSGEKIEQFIGSEGKEWWLEFVNKWNHTNITEFVNVVYTPEQLARLEEIKALKVAEDIAESYVLNGVFPEGLDHPLRSIQMEKDLSDMMYEIMLGGM